MTFIILEDNLDKLTNLLHSYAHVLKDQVVIWCHYVNQVHSVTHNAKDFILFCDDDLGPGRKRGLECLKEMIKYHRESLKRVVITTYSLDAKKTMIQLCEEAKVDYEVLK